MRQCRDHFARLRAMLSHNASQATRSTRRRCRQLLARLSGRERRFQRHTNHVISTTLVRTARSQQAALALEDLTGIRERTNTQPRTKTERRRGQQLGLLPAPAVRGLQSAGCGCRAAPVPAAYTSQMCHACLHIGSRKRQAVCVRQSGLWLDRGCRLQCRKEHSSIGPASKPGSWSVVALSTAGLLKPRALALGMLTRV